MKTLQIQIPDSLDENEVLILLGGKLYESGKLSLGQAAAIAGLSKKTFVEVVGKYGVSIFSSNVDDFDHDLKNA